MITSNQIIQEVARVLKKIESSATVHLERIDKLKPPAFSIEVVSDTSEAFSNTHEQRDLILDIIYFSRKNTQSEAMKMCGKLMSVFLPDFRLDKDKTFTFHHGVETRFVEQDLHCMVHFEWQQEIIKSFVDEDGNLVIYDKTDESKVVVANRLYDLETMGKITTRIERS